VQEKNPYRHRGRGYFRKQVPNLRETERRRNKIEKGVGRGGTSLTHSEGGGKTKDGGLTKRRGGCAEATEIHLAQKGCV